ncbi:MULTISPECIES: HelD family protein [unclassified Kitasatospora]|uniref:HelD family protein n=1 Tax=unclassified Kitasatospora TaxID=2633591 RepID=UPI0037F696C4
MPYSDDRAECQVQAENVQVGAVCAEYDRRLEQTRVELARTLAAPADGAGAVYERDVAAARWAGEVRRLEGAGHGLVFGRLDTADGTTLRIGRLGLHTEADELPLLVDWRAEAARPFYEATPVHPMGLRRRRHLRLDGRTVAAVSDELLDGSDPTREDVIGDGPLLEALSARRTGRMGAAVATLQAEQDAIVRSRHRGVTVVQGGPGTGKTVVALHRAAYVLYAFPRAAERGVLVLGPNTRFLDYICQVLPSLGENDVALATCADLAPATPGPAAPEEPQTARLKGDPALADALAAVVRAHQAPAEDGLAIRVGQEEVHLPQSDLAAAARAATADGLAHNRARDLFKDLLADALTRALERDTADTLDQLDAEVAQLTGLNLDRVAAADLRRLGLDGSRAHDAAGTGDAPGIDGTVGTGDTAGTDGTFDAEAVRAALLDDPHLDRVLDTHWPALTPHDAVRALLTDPAALTAHLPHLSDDQRARLLRAPDAPWTDADLPLLDEAAALLDGPPQRSWGHVVVDEAQELTAMQWRAVLRRCPTRSMTVVGDFAQAGPAAQARDWHEALHPHTGSRFDLHTLTVSYRTTQEILAATTDLLARIAPGQARARAIRHGEPPRTLTAPAHGLAAAVLAELRAQTAAHHGDLLAVVCADARLPELEAAGLPGHVRLVPASEARGLEFDAVLVVDPDQITAARPAGERDLYVALTRATRRLCVIRTAG